MNIKLDEHNIFVGDLAKFCSENSLRDLIAPYGTIKSVRIVRGYEKISLNYGFVTMTSNEEAINAIKYLNGVLFMGRYIKVANARKSELKKKKSVESVINSVYVRFRSQTQVVLRFNFSFNRLIYI